MNIAYFEPLGRAWNRMKNALFKPFELRKWFIVGFNAFLAGITEGHHGSSGTSHNDDMSFGEFLGLPNKAWGWLMDNTGWALFVLFIAFFIIIVIIVLTWLSSRGTFMFMDNVVHDSAEIAKPWKHYKMEGNSLFLWRLCFGFLVFVGVIMFLAFFFITATQLYEENYYRVPVFFIVGLGFLFVLFLIIVGYISMFLKNFVSPIMYKNNITTTKAWGRFVLLFRQHPFHFIFFGILAFVLTILFVIAVIVAGLMTCCIGFVLLIIPYIGTVVTLPVWYTYRAFSLEYLAQFGPEYDVFPPPADTSGESKVSEGGESDKSKASEVKALKKGASEAPPAKK